MAQGTPLRICGFPDADALMDNQGGGYWVFPVLMLRRMREDGDVVLRILHGVHRTSMSLFQTVVCPVGIWGLGFSRFRACRSSSVVALSSGTAFKPVIARLGEAISGEKEHWNRRGLVSVRRDGEDAEQIRRMGMKERNEESSRRGSPGKAGPPLAGGVPFPFSL